MIEWEFSEDGQLPPLPPEPQPPGDRSRRSLLLAAVILLAGVVVAAGLLRQVARPREAALRADLQQAVLAEERARAFGENALIPDLIVADAPESWRQAYATWFAAPRPSQEVALHDVEFDGTSALVTLVVTSTGSLVPGPYSQVRFYRLVSGSWRRAPLPPERWGPVRTLEAGPFLFTYRARDEAFVRALAGDLQRLEQQVAVRWGVPGRAREYAIDVVPYELGGPLVYAHAGRAAVSSPLLLRPAARPLVPADEVRLALGHSLVNDLTAPLAVGLRTYQANGRLLLDTLRETEARLALLSPETRALEQSLWRHELRGNWRSPLTAETASPSSGAPPARIAANLLASYVVAAYGPEAPGALARALQMSTTWEAVLRSALGVGRPEFEAALRAYSLGVVEAEPAGRQQTETSRDLPFEARVVEVTNREAPLVMWVEMPAGPVQVQVWLSDPSRLADGQDLPVSADRLAPGSSVRVEGEWVVPGRRLHATRIEILRGAPSGRGDRPRPSAALAPPSP